MSFNYKVSLWIQSFYFMVPTSIMMPRPSGRKTRLTVNIDLESSNDGGHRVNFDRNLCTYQCKSREGGVRARGGDLMPETIPMLGF